MDTAPAEVGTVSGSLFDMPRVAANFAALTPLSFLTRAASVYPDRLAVIHGPYRATWRQTELRCRRLAAALAGLGARRGETVAILAPNIPAMLEAHFAVPMAGCVLCAINTRLDARTIAYILAHGEARVLLADTEYAATLRAALDLMPPGSRPRVVDIIDLPLDPDSARLGETDYEALLEAADPQTPWSPPADEWDAIALNYTSGTTGEPKGVVYHHRGAWMNAIGNALTWGLVGHPVYLWTLPMFHCNGWCFPWTVAAMAGVNVCLRKVDAAAVWDAFKRHGVTHLCGAPIVMGMIANSPAAEILPHPVELMTAGAAPPAAVIEAVERLGIRITHCYGLTETYGPITVCAAQESWGTLPEAELSAIKARQGVTYAVQDGLMVADPATMAELPSDGASMGEVFMRGNVVMKGYLKNPAATEAAFAGGWFHTGDLAVRHPDGYIEIRDRSKDIIISGGENISTIEVEGALYRHPAVLEAAVVARPDAMWGETPCAFVMLKDGAAASADELIEHCRELLARFKVPRTVVFGPLPKTSTGKMQKYVLRERARSLNSPNDRIA